MVLLTPIILSIFLVDKPILHLACIFLLLGSFTSICLYNDNIEQLSPFSVNPVCLSYYLISFAIKNLIFFLPIYLALF